MNSTIQIHNAMSSNSSNAMSPTPRSTSSSELKQLLHGEKYMVKVEDVVLQNTNQAGQLYVSTFRLLFLSDNCKSIIELGTIPLAAIEDFSKTGKKLPSAPRQIEKNPSQRLLRVIGKDMRIIVFGFQTGTKTRRAVYNALSSRIKPAKFLFLFAFAAGPSRWSNKSPKVNLLNEYSRLLGLGAYRATSEIIKDGLFTLSNDRWRISNVNSKYKICPTYPFALLIPNSISNVEIQEASSFRARCRLPVICWCNPETGAVLARSSQPLTSFMSMRRNASDEKLVAALCTLFYGVWEQRRLSSLVVGIENIYAMRESLALLRDYVDTHGAKSSDGQSSFLRHSEYWLGGNLSSMSASVSALWDSGWLKHIQSVLAGSAWIAARIALESATVLVHCSDGWDRTTQLVSLASLLLDPYYRTFDGFQALVEKDWLAFGHSFSDRLGLPTISGTTSSHAQDHYSPIFLQWVDCVSQLLRMYPFAFEFSSAFLVELLDCVLSCRFGNFLCNSEYEREHARVYDRCGCLWVHLADLRASDKTSNQYNHLYDASKVQGPLLPPAAALAPTLLPQFHLRWACPSEAQAGEIENMAVKISELHKAKDLAEAKR